MPTRRATEIITIENATLLYRNFAGEEGQYNRAGDRNFCVILPEDVAEMMARDGYNIKRRKPRDNDSDDEAGAIGDPYVQVKVSYKGRAPEIYLIGSKTRRRNMLDEGLVPLLDTVEIAECDLRFSPYNWTVRGDSGVTAYLRKMYLTQFEDDLDLKYADVLPAD
jgi:hypothetical protein